MGPERAVDHSPPSSAAVRGQERVGLYLYPPSGPHRACNGKTLLLYIHIYVCVYIYITQINILKFYTNFYYERYVFYSCKVFYICLFEEPSLRRSEKGRNISDSE